jgi:hypothetical protein
MNDLLVKVHWRILADFPKSSSWIFDPIINRFTVLRHIREDFSSKTLRVFIFQLLNKFLSH